MERTPRSPVLSTLSVIVAAVGCGPEGLESSPGGARVAPIEVELVPWAGFGGDPHRLGFNMLRTVEDTAFADLEDVLDDVVEVGGGAVRQLQGRDLSWFSLTEGGDLGRSSSYDFGDPDELFELADARGLAVIPTLFQIGNVTQGSYFGVECEDAGSHGLFDPKYCKQPYTPNDELLKVSDDSVAEDVEDYVRMLGTRYGSKGRDFEVGNEWELQFEHDDWLVAFNFAWEPAKYADLLALVSDTLASTNADHRVVFGGLSYLDNYDTDARQELWEDWLDKVLEKGGGPHFDVMSFHYYGNWGGLEDHIAELRALLAEHGQDDKPLWMTEVGTSATGESETEQARDVVRMFSIAFAHGVERAHWHTHISSHDGASSWGGYGLRKKHGGRYSSWFTYQLFAQRLGNFSEVVARSEGRDDLWVYEFKGLGPLGRSSAFVAFSDRAGAELDLGDLFDDGVEVEVTEMVTTAGTEFPVGRAYGGDTISVGLTPVLLTE